MKRTLIGLAFVAAFVGAALAQVPGLLLISPIQFTAGTGAFSFMGPSQVAGTPVSGGTFVCTGGGTPTITNTKITANSVMMFGLKTKGGTPATPIQTTVVVGASMVVTCGGSDTSTYNYLIIG